MAIVYENGTATDRYNFGDKIRIFLLANGWTINGSDLSNGGGLHVSKGGNYFNVYFSSQSSNRDERLWISLALSTGYLGPPGAAQPGEVHCSTDIRCATVLSVSLYQEYYFFLDTTSDTFYMVLEETLGVYRHMAFGSYNTIGQTPGVGIGQFVWGNYLDVYSAAAGHFDNSWPAWAYASLQNPVTHPGQASFNRGSGREVLYGGVDSGSPGEKYFGDVPTSDSTSYNPWGNTGMQMMAFHCSTNTYNNRIAMLPINLWVTRPSALHTLAGQWPSVRLVNLKNIAPEQVIDGDWMCFPLYRKATSGDWATGNIGLAYKKV